MGYIVLIDICEILSIILCVARMKNFFRLFKPKAISKSSVSVVPNGADSVKKTDDSPKIEYITYTVNQHNIAAYRSGRLQMIGGDSVGNKVRICRYDIDPELNLQPDDEIYKIAETIRAEEKKTILHELKHLKNAELGHPCFIVENYYEISGLHAFDEVSAYTTAYLNSKVPTFEEVCLAVSYGIDDLLYRKDWYIPRHMQQVRSRLMLKCIGKDYATAKQYIEQNLQPRYGNRFNKTVSAYLTFDGQCLYERDKTLPNELKQKLSSLRQTYETATHATLQCVLEQMAHVLR